ncbi:hypothetical protein HK099_000479, partial [Clydaea vesicula]
MTPNLVVATCLYLATKIEESPHHIKSVVSEMKSALKHSGGFCFEAQDIAEFEYYLLEDLNFNTILFHPYRSLLKFTKSLQLEEKITEEAWAITNDTYNSDLLLNFAPHLIALASLKIAIVVNKKHESITVKKWFQNINVDWSQ